MKKIIISSLSFLLLTTSFMTPANASVFSKEEVIITFKDEIDHELLEKYGVEVTKEFKNIPSVSAKVSGVYGTILNANDEVLSMAKDVPIKLNSVFESYGNEKVKAPFAWDAAFTGKGVKIGVIDTGVDIQHSDLRIKGGVSFIKESDGYTGYNDYNGHGTHVTGIIGAVHNTIGIDGVAPDADLYAIKVFDKTGLTSASNIISGVDWAIENKMDVINMSLGLQSPVQPLEDILKVADEKGIVLIAGAGNDGNTDPSVDTVDYPAKYDTVVAVSATDENNKRGEFTSSLRSSSGPAVDITAPGVSIISTEKGNMMSYRSGTSMAAPFVTGVVALLKEANPRATNKEIKQMLIDNALDIGPKGKDVQFGHGLIQFALNENKSEVTNLSETHKDTSATLTWKNPGTNFKEVKIYKNGTYLTKTSLSTFEDKQLSPNTSYTYKLTTVNTSGLESKGVTINVKTDTLYPIPKQVENISFTPTENSIELKWKKPNDTIYKHVEIYRNGVLITKTDKESYMDTPLSSSTTYSYEFISVSDKDKKSEATSFMAKTKESTTPQAPDNLKFVIDYKQKKITLTWDKSKENNVTGYHVFMNNKLMNKDPISENKYIVNTSNFNESETYTFTVRAVNNLDNVSLPSNPVNTTLIEPLRFTDVANNHWAYDDIRFVSEKNWMKGKDTVNTFAPNTSLTRAEAAVIFVRSLNLKAKETIKPSFKDIKNHWAYNEIAIAEQYGLFKGTSKGAFSPNKSMSRAEIAVVLSRVINNGKTPAQGSKSPFSDLANNHWAYHDIVSMHGKNIITGYENGTFKPSNNMSRAEMASLMKRSSTYFK